MTVQAGQSLLQYQLVEKIGEGGMGVVWKANDTTLGRDVAIKILPPDFAGDADRLARFEREARLLASLSHPNIATVHGLHEDRGIRFLAMELVPGQDLSRRLAAGALPIDEALILAGDVAAALESAHSNGVIHRDLKPANVQLTPDGGLKVLDFGLAKALTGDPGDSSGTGDVAASPTITSAGTLAGTILGTAAYMSPEQARGKPVDRRVDVWAFGCLLYEMLTGRRAFPGETPAEVIGAVLHAQPDFTMLPPRTPRGIRRLLTRCLRKKPAERLRDMGDAGIEIAEAIADDTEETSEATVDRRAPIWRTVLPWVLTVAAVSIAIAFWRPEPPPPPVTRTTLSLAEGSGLLSEPALSADGRTLVYAASDDSGDPILFRRSLDRFDAGPIPGTADATQPFLSPDSRWVGFQSAGRLWKVPIEGGGPTEICRTELWFRATWLPDDTIVFGPDLGSGLQRVPASGGDVETLTTPDTSRGEVSHGNPHLLPDGDTLLFTIGTGQGSQIGALSLKSGEWRWLLDGAAGARYLATGHLLFSRGGTLHLVPFDLDTLTTTGAPVSILEGVFRKNIGGLEMARFAVSPGGTLVYAVGSNADFDNTFVLIERDGTARRLELEPGSYMHPRVSPDGRRIAYSGVDEENGTGDVWVLDLDRGGKSRVTVEGASYTPIWTPDGKRLAYVSNGNILWTAADGSSPAEPLLVQDDYNRPFSFSPDGRTLAFATSGVGGDLAFLAMQDRTIRRVETPFNEMAPAFSPDGHLVAYVSNESGRDEIHVRSWPELTRKWTVSTEGGRWPAWSANGAELFYRSGDRFFQVDVTRTPDTAFGRPQPLFEGDYHSQTMVPNYDVWPDGRRFVTVERSAPTQDRLRVVQNWFSEIAR